MLLAGCSGRQSPAMPPEARPAVDVAVTDDAGSLTVPPAGAPEEHSDGVHVADASFDDDFSLDDYDDPEQPEFADPLEPWNRFWFRFNDVMLIHVFKPLHTGYARAVPASLRGGLSHFAHNLASPVRFFNSLLQGKFTQAGVEFGRFFINTVTSFGFADVASQNKPLYPYHPETENLGHTLGVWGLPQGPYIVWPFFGPTTIRGTFGRVGDAFMTPQNYAVPLVASLSVSTGLTFNGLDSVYGPYEQVTKASLEPYVAIRNAYLTLLQQSR